MLSPKKKKKLDYTSLNFLIDKLIKLDVQDCTTGFPTKKKKIVLLVYKKTVIYLYLSNSNNINLAEELLSVNIIK